MSIGLQCATRRGFLAGSASLGAGLLLAQEPQAAAPKRLPMPRTAPPYDKNTINLIGPRAGYSPHVGTIVTMLTWMEPAVLGPTRGLSQQDLDFLLDKNANSIGALMLHLAATEVLYQRMTFNNENFDKYPADYAARWGAAMDLGDAGRASIKGHEVAYYQDAIREAREKTLTEFAKRDDAWLLTPLKEPGWGGGPVNNYCLWFHVCEHISHHAGQIDLSAKRVPGAKAGGSTGG
jgi:uncharacterized damage-inducible protein DinB